MKEKQIDLERRLTGLERKCINDRQKHSCETLKRTVHKLLTLDNQLMVVLTGNELTVALIENKVMLLERFCLMSEKMKKNLTNLPVEICKENNLESMLIN